MLKSWRKWPFRRVVLSETAMMELSFEVASSGSIVLSAMVEKGKPLLDTIRCFSQPQSPSTATAKTAPFPGFSTSHAPNAEEGGIFGTHHQWMDCTLGDDGSKGPFTYCYLLSQSFDTAAPRFLLQFRAKTTLFRPGASHHPRFFQTHHKWIDCA